MSAGCLRGDTVGTPPEPTTTEPEPCEATWFVDADGDGFGDATQTACAGASGAAANDEDCDDTDAAINPGALEICTANAVRDEDCNPATEDPVAMVGTKPYGDLQSAVTSGGALVEVCAGQRLEVTAIQVTGEVVIQSIDLDPNSVRLVGGLDSAFELQEDASLTLQSVQLEGAEATLGGIVRGGSFDDGLVGEVTFIDVVALENQAENGGVVAARSVRVESSRFRSNTALSTGGAIVADVLTVTDSTFSENRATEGGAAYVRGSMTSQTSTFEGNQAEEGGALALRGDQTDASTVEVTLSDSTFTTNTATRSGGALFVRGVHILNATGSTFNDNAATDPNDTREGRGGAVAVADKNLVALSWTGGTFLSNHAQVSAGAISIGCGDTGADVTMTEVIARANSAITAGAVQVLNTCSLAWNQGELTQNVANGLGGAIWALGDSTVRLEDVDLIDNEALTGAAIAISPASDISLVDSTVWRNDAPQSGALHLLRGKGATLTLTRCDLGVDPNDNDDADVVGGGVQGTPDWTADFGAGVSQVCTQLGCQPESK